ncbi:MAG: signal peptidase I [Planctomycetes bacterium]|nr:signal peptidase I [Planctomycetota bacterium]
MTEPVLKAAPPKGYAKLKPELRQRIADILTGAGVVVSMVALFVGSNLEGVWLRLPVLLALLILLPVTWFVHRRLGVKASPVLAGGLVVALIGVSVLSMALHKASGGNSLAGFLGLLSAITLRGAVDRGVVRGRDVRVGERGAISVIVDQAESLAAALVLVLLVWHFGLEAFRIPSGSMAPTLLGDPVTGDRVLVDKFVYAWRDPARWEPTVFRYPLRRTDPYVKRTIALPLEQVLIAQGDVYVRAPGGSIELLRKTPAARDELWLPIIEHLSSNTAWVSNFKRDGDLAFEDGLISLRKRGVVMFPRGGTDDLPGDVTDHDASFGATETPADRYGKHVVGDLRIRADVKLGENGELSITLVRDEDAYTLTMRPGPGGCKLVHDGGDGAYGELAVEHVSAIDLVAGDTHLAAFSLADGLLRLDIDGANHVSENVGTPLLDQLIARDAEGSINLAGPVALEIAGAEPPDGRKSRIELRGGAEHGAEVRIVSIDRDIYYIGRTLNEFGESRELPFQVELGEEQYFVLGDNSPGSLDSRYWSRVSLFLSDGTQVVGSLDGAPQPELAQLLMQSIREGEAHSAHEKLTRVAHFTPAERGHEPGTDGNEIADALAQLKETAKSRGRAAIDFYTEGGGYVRVKLADIERLQVERVPYVQRKLFVGRPFAVFLSPRGMKLID